MNCKKIAVVVGTRPEVIKMAPVIFALRDSEYLEPVLLSTGQHREMLDQALAAFGLVPDFDLGLMQPGQTLPGLTSRAIEAVTQFIAEQHPAAILVQGDTSTVLAGAMASFFCQRPGWTYRSRSADRKHALSFSRGDESTPDFTARKMALPSHRNFESQSGKRSNR